MNRPGALILVLILFSFRQSAHRVPIPTPPAHPHDAPYAIRILCLYGSVPAKGYWDVEPFHGPHNIPQTQGRWMATFHQQRLTQP